MTQLLVLQSLSVLSALPVTMTPTLPYTIRYYDSTTCPTESDCLVSAACNHDPNITLNGTMTQLLVLQSLSVLSLVSAACNHDPNITVHYTVL
jgi:hypothetical protein